MNTLSEMAKAQEPTGLTREAFDEALKLLDSVESSRPLFFSYNLFSSNLIGEHKATAVKKTWKERLFSWPWRPWRKMKIIYTIEPTGELLIIERYGSIYGHPVDIKKLERAIEEYDNTSILKEVNNG